MYDLLIDVCKRPEPFSRYTTKELWTRPHLAQQMLEYHLSQETDLASRRLSSAEQAVEWTDAQLDLSGKALCDLGCGPGLYTRRFGLKGATVTGVDISTMSLDHAQQEDPKTTYIQADERVLGAEIRIQLNT